MPVILTVTAVIEPVPVFLTMETEPIWLSIEGELTRPKIAKAVEKLTNEDSTLILTQGFQQGYFEIVPMVEPFSNNFELKVYPNPATEYIWISLESEEIKDALIEIFDLEGKVVYSNQWNFVNGPNQVMLNNMGSSQYILRISDKSGQVLQTFKLIKR